MAVPDIADRQNRFDTACGRTIRAWATLELTLFMLFEGFFGEHGDTEEKHFNRQRRLRIIWHNLLTYQAKRKTLMVLAETFMSGDDVQKLTRLLQRASGLANRRNALAHCIGGIDSDTGAVVLRSDARDGDVGFCYFEKQEFQLTNVENWPNDIKTLNDDFMKTIMEFSIYPLPKTFRE